MTERSKMSEAERPRVKLHIERLIKEEITYIRLSGIIDRDCESTILSAASVSGYLILDLSGVERITSFGIQKWIDFIDTVASGGSKIYYVQCSPTIMHQFNMVANFGGTGCVVSFFAPYRCETCDCEVRRLCRTDEHMQFWRAGFAPPFNCPHCNNAQSFDDDPRTYFDYAANIGKLAIPAPVLKFLENHLNFGQTVVTQENLSNSAWAQELAEKLERKVAPLQPISVDAALSPTSQMPSNVIARAAMNASESPMYSLSKLRKLVNRVLQTDSDFEAFCLDFFPEVRQEFANSMDRTQKTSLLLIKVPQEKLLACLRSAVPEGMSLAEASVTQEPPQEPLPVDEVADLKRERERRIKHGEPTDEIDRRLNELRRQHRHGRLRKVDEVIDGRYALHEKLDDRGLAQVWRAYDRNRSRTVALKLLRGKHALDRSKIDRFFHGANVIERLRHPGIIRIHDGPRSSEGGEFFFILEYLPGGSLSEAVTQGRISRLAGVNIILSVCEALADAHRHGVIHRDIGPRKILLDGSGGTRLTGFDLSVCTEESFGDLSRITITELPCSDPTYVSFEQQRGGMKAADVRSDLFSLAMVMVFILLGRELTENDLADRRSMLATVQAPQPLRAILSRALSGAPTARHRSVWEFIYEIRSLSTDEEYSRWLLS